MSTADAGHGLRGATGAGKRITGWYLAAAVLFILLGVFAIIHPAIVGLGVTVLVGWLLIFGGLGHMVAAWRRGGGKQAVFQVLIAMVYLLGGLYFLTHVIMATETLTMWLGAIILAEGVLEVISYMRLRAEGASRWLLLNGVVTLVLGGLIWFHWPSSAVWAIGTLVGVNLLMTGITRLMFGLAVRKTVLHVAG